MAVFCNNKFWTGLLMVFIPFVSYSQNIYDTLRTVKMTAVTNPITPSITINWADDVGDNTYSLYKKTRPDTTWGEPLITTTNQAAAYVDEDVELNKLYEYRIIKETGNHLGYAYPFKPILVFYLKQILIFHGVIVFYKPPTFRFMPHNFSGYFLMEQSSQTSILKFRINTMAN